MIYIGIDPGFYGGIAILMPNKKNYVYKMPIITHRNKKYLNLKEIKRILRYFEDKNTIIYIEQAHSMPHQGIVSTFRYGEGYGALQGIVCALNINYKLIPSQVWKKYFNLSSDKKKSIALVHKLYSKIEIKKSWDGIAEALLIAHYAKEIEGETYA